MSLSVAARRQLEVALGVSPQYAAEIADAIDASTAADAAESALASGAIILGNGAGVAADVVPAGDVTIDNAGVTAIGAGKVTNAMVAPNALDGTVAKNVANANVVGGIPVVFTINVADASADTDVVTTHKIRVYDFTFQATGIAGHASLDTVQLKSTASAITDAIAKTATVNKVVRASTIDPANATIAAGGIIRITAAKNTNAAGVATVYAVRSA